MNCVCQYTQTCYQDTYSLNIFNSNLSSSTAIYTLSLHDALPISPMREDTSFATFYLISLGLGVLLVSVRGSNVDLMHVLFGSVLGLDDLALLTVTLVSSFTLGVFTVIYRPLVMDSMDPYFKKFNARASFWAHMLFLVLLVITLVAGFQVLGTLMVVGLMILPAAAARFLVQSAHGQLLMSALLAVLASYIGLLGSYHFDEIGRASCRERGTLCGVERSWNGRW